MAAPGRASPSASQLLAVSPGKEQAAGVWETCLVPGWPQLRSGVPFGKDKDEYLTRPDLGRRFEESQQKVIATTWNKARVMVVIGDGLSSAAIEANALDCAAAIRQGLQNAGITVDKTPFVQYCRVGAGDHIGDLTGCELLCLLVGERPGLVTSESMSAYITYRPHIGVLEAKRTVVSNIHRQGLQAVEAGAHIASLMVKMLEQKASGIDLKQEA